MAAVVATVPAAKAPRKLEGVNPDGRALRRMERDAEERIYQALQKWGRSLFRGVTAESVALLVARLDDPEFSKPMRDAMIAVLQDIAGAGADFGRQQVERGVFGIKRTARIDADSVDWTAANEDALRWAIEYGYNLIRGITDTTRRMIANEIRYFVDNSITINQLRDRIMSGNLFSRRRASMIAVTETTRAYAEGNTAAWRASGVIEGREWQTAVDELVCPLCGPLHGKIAKMGESFGPVTNPPRHVNCRCWVVPVVMGDDEVLSEVGVGPWGNAGEATISELRAALARGEWYAEQVEGGRIQYMVRKGDILPDDFDPDHEAELVRKAFASYRQRLINDPNLFERLDASGAYMHPDLGRGGQGTSINVVFTTNPNDYGMGSGGRGSAKVFWGPYSTKNRDAVLGRLADEFGVDPIYVLNHELHHAFGSNTEFDTLSDIMTIATHFETKASVQMASYQFENKLNWALVKAKGDLKESIMQSRAGVRWLTDNYPEARAIVDAYMDSDELWKKISRW